MNEETIGCSTIICSVIILVIFGFICFGAGFIIGTDNITKDTNQKLCKEFTKTPSEYINCNAKDIDTIVKIIKENKQ